jgi:hypothetical protein
MSCATDYHTIDLVEPSHITSKGINRLTTRSMFHVPAGLWLSLLIPAKLLWPWFLTNPVWLAWRRYFRFSAIFDAQMELLDTKYVIAGVLACAREGPRAQGGLRTTIT